ncbi:hypothetical protein [Streptomyces sp. NPDC059943]|uniref:hypothetical protein n=1 Tax=Streptomyces sp. NPDC059943 TaxID=3347010 RepID=UPI003664608B
MTTRQSAGGKTQFVDKRPVALGTPPDADSNGASNSRDCVRQLAERWRYTGDSNNTALPELRANLDGPKEH